MTSRPTHLARAGAAALLVTGVLAGLTAPASAATAPAPPEADLSIEMVGLTVAGTVTGKNSSVKVTNRSRATVKRAGVVFALGNVDTKKIDVPVPDGCQKSDVLPEIGVPSRLEGPFLLCLTREIRGGASETFDFRLVRKGGVTRDLAGALTVVAVHEGRDPNMDNNVHTGHLRIGADGWDVRIVAPDVYARPPKDKPTEERPVAPGQTTDLWTFIENQGETSVGGLKFTITLPPNVTLAESRPGCVVGADNRTATCTYPSASLLPADQDKDKESPADGTSYAWVSWPVTVAKGAKGPAALTGGAVTLQGLGYASIAPNRSAGAKVAALPDNFTLDHPPHLIEVDPSDNADDFAVFVAGPKVAPSASPAPGTGGTGGGTLPVTGPQAALIGSAGMAALVAGGVLFLLARRRRVVLVTPGDERTPAA